MWISSVMICIDGIIDTPDFDTFKVNPDYSYMSVTPS